MSNSKIPQRKQRAMGDTSTGKAGGKGVQKFAKGGGVNACTDFAKNDAKGRDGTPSKRASSW